MNVIRNPTTRRVIRQVGYNWKTLNNWKFWFTPLQPKSTETSNQNSLEQDSPLAHVSNTFFNKLLRSFAYMPAAYKVSLPITHLQLLHRKQRIRQISHLINVYLTSFMTTTDLYRHLRTLEWRLLIYTIQTTVKWVLWNFPAQARYSHPVNNLWFEKRSFTQVKW